MSILHLTLYALSLSVYPSPVIAGDALWQRAVAISAFNRGLVPGNWVEREEIFDPEGDSHLVSRRHVSFSQTGSKVNVNLVEAISNGVPITDQLRETFDKISARFSMKPQYNPFRPAVQKDVSAKRDGRTRRDGEDVWVAYDYSQKTESGRWQGTAWIDETTGVPVELNARLTGLPKMDDRDKIREVVVNVTFVSGKEKRWYASKITIFSRSILNNFPYTDFYATTETAILLDSYWKIAFH